MTPGTGENREVRLSEISRVVPSGFQHYPDVATMVFTTMLQLWGLLNGSTAGRLNAVWDSGTTLFRSQSPDENVTREAFGYEKNWIYHRNDAPVQPDEYQLGR